MKYSALIGNPVEHSIAPKLFDLLTKKLNIEYSHIKIMVQNRSDLPEVINSLKKLKFIGFNITCPYKLDVFNLLSNDECDDEVLKVHSVNSIVINNDKIKGYNTDGKAAIMAIKHFYNLNASDKVIILGAGGAAHSILYEILKITKNVTVFNENIEMADKMCCEIDNNVSRYLLYDSDKLYEEIEQASLVINATSVGMSPNENCSLLDFSKIKSKKVYFDVIFNPWETAMIKDAKKRGNLVISGGYMLIYQAILVLKLWLNTEIYLTIEQVDDIANELINYLEEIR